MSDQEVHEPTPRFVVQIGSPVKAMSGAVMRMDWEFHSAHYDQAKAVLSADRLAESHEHVRVIDRTGRA